jgi:hypothetical protein
MQDMTNVWGNPQRFENPAGFDNPQCGTPGACDKGIDNPQGFEDPQSAEDAVALAIDAADDEEFLGRALQLVRRIGHEPVADGLARRALPMAGRLVRGGSGRWLGSEGLMEAFADAAALESPSAAALDEFVPVLAGVAARHVLNSLVPPAARAALPAASRTLGRAVTHSVANAARGLVGRFGPSAVRAVPKIVRHVVSTMRANDARPSTAPHMIESVAARVAAKPGAVRIFARPNARVRRAVTQALRNGDVAAPAGCGCRGHHLTIRGPVRIDIRH